MYKRLFLALYTVIAVCLSATAQIKPVIKKIHAYRQATVPGIPPAGNAERKPTYNYWIYIENSGKISVVDIWISGKRFSVKTEPVTKTPVMKLNYNGASGVDTVTLVPESRYNVMLIYPSGKIKDSSIGSKYVSGIIKKSELVIGYFWKGKKYFAPVKAFISLEPDISS
jgi:hypothetical protein